jgi:hypothetical protein
VVLPTRRATASHTDFALNGERLLRSSFFGRCNSFGCNGSTSFFLIRLNKGDFLSVEPS